MTLLTVKQAAEYLGYKNYKSLYNNKVIPRKRRGGKVWFILEELQTWIMGEPDSAKENGQAPGRPLYRVKVRA